MALAPVETTIRSLGDMLRSTDAFLPRSADIFRAFQFPFEKVRVLVVGQDPYPTVGHAMGLSFSVRDGIEIPKSLRNIFTELQTDLGCPPPTNGNLSPWADQGVCLMNRVLTVAPGSPGSHRGRGWEQVTQCAIKALADRRDPQGNPVPLVAILWGRDAATASALLGNTPIIKSAHPSPLSAYRGFFGSKPFSTANQYLEKMGSAPINWCLP